MKTVLITGTTSGIGYSLSAIFAEKGYHVILVSRNPDQLLEQQKNLQTPHNRVDSLVYDLEQPGAAQSIYEMIKANNWSIDILVNNAGFNEAGLFAETNAQREREMIELHVNFVTDMMKLFIPAMTENGVGRVLNVGSTGSYIACPKDAVYAATKAYVLHLSKAVNSELRGTGVSVTTLCPGSTNTKFAEKADIENTLLFKLFVMSPDKVAKAGFHAMCKRKAVVIPGVYNKLLVASSRILPYSFIGWLTKKML
ncbi:SDR family oxidoreductase [Enterococcus casseliflavus]|uniref:SDR family NAD(P)-dependent oxidoreductase n=1 Tax=Enterococcus TaxID=1350 RepID=UPI0009BD0FB8|nr:SDR family oxidoreductase [Enterococcus innesii]MBW9322063.1 SDR family oxidoreductase [Enterococcus casseliflavus]MCO5497162.1 SDR family oxidoreductase [Enterococcus innesii]OQO85093.1 oxidoreductase [Enterococcus casseliflavus]